MSADHVRTLDVDGHEFAPLHLWGDVFGATGERFMDLIHPYAGRAGEGYIVRPDTVRDDSPMTLANVWTERHTGAPGAFDMVRRLEAMDLMGVRRQLIFPSFGLWGQIMTTAGPTHPLGARLRGDLTLEDAEEFGFAGIDAHNDWAVRTTRIDPDRLRPVGMLKRPRDVDDLVAQATGLLDAGLRALLINTGLPPAGVSPAAPELDEFWALLAGRGVPVLAHLGGEYGFLSSAVWNAAPAFATDKLMFEVGGDAHSFATLHLAASNWLTVMVLGGVFERHPGLRFGAIECGAHWLGPLADSLDMWVTKVFTRRMEGVLSMRPSEYIARNVRVTPQNICEPVDEFMTRYPHLSTCYCFSTDYPHIEGGTDIEGKVHALLAPLGEEVVEQYFVTNGELLLPD